MKAEVLRLLYTPYHWLRTLHCLIAVGYAVPLWLTTVQHVYHHIEIVDYRSSPIVHILHISCSRTCDGI